MTRTIRKAEGFYSEKNQLKIATKRQIPAKTNIKSRVSKYKEREALNLQILKNLKNFKKKSIFVCIKIESTTRFVKFLQDEYAITNKFKDCDELIHDLKLSSERWYNERNFCSIDEGSFMIRLTSARNFTYFDQTLNKISIKGQPKVMISFTRKDNIAQIETSSEIIEV
jgi:hypothetical protein